MKLKKGKKKRGEQGKNKGNTASEEQTLQVKPNPMNGEAFWMQFKGTNQQSPDVLKLSRSL